MILLFNNLKRFRFFFKKKATIMPYELENLYIWFLKFKES